MSQILTDYKLRLKQLKIDNYKIPESTEEVLTVLKYTDRAEYTFTFPYKRKYHFGEVFNRIVCQEKNKPNTDEIGQIKSLLNDYSLNSIYKVCNYNQRKHLIYIWHVLNNIELPIVTSKITQMKETLLYNLNKFYSIVVSCKSIKYRLIMDVICEHYDFNELRQYLYFKDNIKHRMKVKQVLEF